MKKTLQFNFKFSKKILAGALLAGIAMTATSKLNAQIVYVDIPDGIPSSIDFNSDGNPEFHIGTNGSDIDYYSYGPANNIHAINAANWDTPSCVAAGFVIGSSGNWLGFGDASLDGWGVGNSTLPAANTDKYIAVKFNLTGNNTNVYYGWIRISRSSTGAIIYKDYAYKSVPNTSIQAGEKNILATTEVEFSKLNIYPNPVKENLYFSNEGNIGKKLSSYTISNFAGQIIVNGKISGNSINVSSLSTGIYFIEFTDEKGNKSETKKLIKE